MKLSFKRASIVLVVFIFVAIGALAQKAEEPVVSKPYQEHVLPLSLEALGLKDGQL